MGKTGGADFLFALAAGLRRRFGWGTRRGGLGFLARIVGFLHPTDVGDGFAIGRNSFELVDALRAGVVSGEREDQIVVVAVEKFAKIFCSGFNVFLRVENI